MPELFAIGFELNAHAWSSAEPQGGPTERWLADDPDLLLMPLSLPPERDRSRPWIAEVPAEYRFF